MSDLPVTPAARIIAKFGSQEKLAAAIRSKQTTVSYWKQRGYIPARHQAEILRAAQRLNIDLSPADFFPSELTAAE